VCQHDCAAIAAEGILEQMSEFGIQVGNVHGLRSVCIGGDGKVAKGASPTGRCVPKEAPSGGLDSGLGSLRSLGTAVFTGVRGICG
jgi:hypothetical protein